MKIFPLVARHIKIIVLCSLIFGLSPAFTEPMAIFSADQHFSPLSAGKAKMLFKGKVKRLNSKKYSLVDWPAGSPIKEKFYLSLMGQSEAKVNATRAKLIFSGQGFPPKIIPDNNFSTLETFLKNHPSSIGYAPVSKISDEFNILFILPTEKQ